MITRVNRKRIIEDLNKKMVFLSGPRQVGKTTFAKSLSSVWKELEYLNYDSTKDRSIFFNETWDRDKELIIFDEIHKFKNWKNKIKGVYDTEGNLPRLLVTGSARLNVFRKTGDSLAGRYFNHRLYPFSYKELASQITPSNKILTQMMRFGNFPEPFLSQTETDAKRWRKSYTSLVMTQDVVQIADIKDLSSLQLLVDLLRSRVGSPVSFNSIARDLAISPNTVKRYIEILEHMYLIFRITPYHRNIARAILKEPKIYFFDIGLVIGDDGKKFENLIAFHLLKHLHYLEDTMGADIELHYIRDRQGHEIDFYYKCEDAPAQLVEVKLSDTALAKNLSYFNKRLNLESTQVVLNLNKVLQYGKIKCIPAESFLNLLAC